MHNISGSCNPFDLNFIILSHIYSHKKHFDSKQTPKEIVSKVLQIVDTGNNKEKPYAGTHDGHKFEILKKDSHNSRGLDIYSSINVIEKDGHSKVEVVTGFRESDMLLVSFIIIVGGIYTYLKDGVKIASRPSNINILVPVGFFMGFFVFIFGLIFLISKGYAEDEFNFLHNLIESDKEFDLEAFRTERARDTIIIVVVIVLAIVAIVIVGLLNIVPVVNHEKTWQFQELLHLHRANI